MRLPLERLGYTALVVLLLSPAVAEGIGVPLAWGLDVPGNALGLALGALAVAGVALGAAAMTLDRAAGRWLPTLCAGVAAPLIGLAVGGAGGGWVAATGAMLGVAALAGLLAPWLVRRLPAELDGLAARRRGAAMWMILLALAALNMNTRLAVFMGDAGRPDLSMFPAQPFLVHHSCLTAYVEAARLAGEGMANVYDAAAYPDLSGSAGALAAAQRYAPFHLDAYAYPPPFLLLPRLLLTPLEDFAAQRALWYALNALALALGLWTLPRWIGGASGIRTLLLAPAVWLGSGIFVLQVGNAHGLVMVVAMLAMVAFETRRPALGGALLAFAAITKISPGLLVILLLVQRRTREVLWTALFGAIFLGASVAVFGTAPLHAFLGYELPALDSGEALRFMTGPDSAPINLAPVGVPFKLALLGFELSDPWALARRLAQVYTVLAVGLTALAGRRRGGRRAMAESWAAVLTLAALRSPLAPPYILLTVYWLMSIRSNDVRGWRGVLAATLLWVFAVYPPIPQPAAGVVFGLVQQTGLIGISAYFMLRKAPEDTPGPALGLSLERASRRLSGLRRGRAGR